MKQHFQNLYDHSRQGGWKGAAFWFSKLAHRKLVPEIEGNHVFDFDWDLLVILDGCRPEWLADEWPNRPFSGTVESAISVGSHSREWLEKTFDEAHRPQWEQTAYVSANYHTSIPPGNELLEFRPLRGSYFDDSIQTIPAHYVTNHTIEVGRELAPPRTIAHYLQPHVPFVEKGAERTDLRLRDICRANRDAFWKFIRGDLSRTELETEYKINLQYVLDEVELLVKNFDADRVLVTADHGNAFGERFLYQHPNRVRSKHIRAIPWVVTEALDERTVVDVDTQPGDRSSLSMEDQLAALGYR